LTKPEVREIAAQMELVTAEKKDSQGLCFYKFVYRNFATKITAKRRSIIQIEKTMRYMYVEEQEGVSTESIVISFE
jgi:tRNA-specific 2-thiouridylase